MLSLFFFHLKFRADAGRHWKLISWKLLQKPFKRLYLRQDHTFHTQTLKLNAFFPRVSSRPFLYFFFFISNELISCLVKALNLLQYTYYRISCSFPTSLAKRWCAVGSHKYSPRDSLWIRALLCHLYKPCKGWRGGRLSRDTQALI